MNQSSHRGLADLKVYQLALVLEDQTYQLAKQLPGEQFYPLGNDLRRGSAAVAHYIQDSYNRYSYKHKMDALHAAREHAEKTRQLLLDNPLPRHHQLAEQYLILIKQCWGLIKYFQRQKDQVQTKNIIASTDELVASRTK